MRVWRPHGAWEPVPIILYSLAALEHTHVSMDIPLVNQAQAVGYL